MLLSTYTTNQRIGHIYSFFIINMVEAFKTFRSFFRSWETCPNVWQDGNQFSLSFPFPHPIFQKLLALQTQEFVVYKPHCYADEGQDMANAELDAISISENDFHPEMLRNLDNRFSQLAIISRPDLMRKWQSSQEVLQIFWEWDTEWKLEIKNTERSGMLGQKFRKNGTRVFKGFFYCLIVLK